MPVQNSNFKITARPNSTTNLLQILIPITFYSLSCQKEVPQLCLAVNAASYYKINTYLCQFKKEKELEINRTLKIIFKC